MKIQFSSFRSFVPYCRTLKDHQHILIEELGDSAKALIASIAQEMTGKHILILTGASREEAKLFHDFAFFTDAPLVDYPAWETLPSEKVPPSSDIVGERYEVLEKILHAGEPHIILSSLQATLQKLIEPDSFKALHFSLKVKDTCPFTSLIEQLEKNGYERKPVASDKGEFAIRGGIVDIFPVSSPDPFRVEFWGDEVESLRIYDPIGQKSIKKVDQITINPAKELELLDSAPKLATLFDYLGNDTIVVLDDLLALEDRYASLSSMVKGHSSYFLTMDELFQTLKPLQTIYLPNNPIEQLSKVEVLEQVQGSVYSKQNPIYKIGFEMFGKALEAKRWTSPFMSIASYFHPENQNEEGLSEEEVLEQLHNQNRDEEWHFLFNSESEKNTFLTKIKESGSSLPPKSHLHQAYLTSGFSIPDEQFILFPLTEITHRYKIRRQRLRSTYHTPPTEFFELQPGDLVVHINNGIGRFLGMEKKADHEGNIKEFFLLEYANNSKLFVPMNQAHLITKYIGATESIPSLHQLGGTKWKRAKEKTQVAILGYAKDLLDHYAKRSVSKGFACPPDSDDTILFEEEFPFDETQDQLSAIANIKQDMESDKVMDRLICGDVGYGKTEVAMRTAFKTVVDGGKQVAVLVPTTVLAMQHYDTFVERMSDFPINIAVLSRFNKTKERNEAIEGIAKGTVDILIGTHRIISKDVLFKDLGLVIIDEEQRFGVRAKEHLKQMKTGVECLTLSATPIPRTLYLSLMGARDLSIINTPPQDRIPIKTAVVEPTDDLIRNALLRELSRDGQAFVIHNRVDSIYERASAIKKLLPNARVIVGHGQMSPAEIDSVFHTFKQGNADILVATTIVENGIDIPNANTIIIDKADHFGLAELYQLRGRVGRWNRQAYAYFLVPRLRSLPEFARKRLLALAEASGYGGGMKIALRDLEIRGAGNILGDQQSGQVETIGFHQYCKWLKRAVQTIQGKISPQLSEAKVEARIDARLPEDYVNEISLRMEFYQRFGEALSLKEVDEISSELKDRFGALPEPAEWLVALSKVKTEATLQGVQSIEVGKVSIKIERKKGKETIVKHIMQKPKTEPEIWTEQIIALLRS